MDWLPTIAGRRGPAYQRIVDALADDIAAGQLHQGQQLPTHRALATWLGLDVTTVTRAYGEARRLQLIEAHTGRGTFVAATPAPLRRTGVAPTLDLSMILPPQPAGADLDRELAATLAELQRRTGFASFLSYQQAGGTRAERNAAARWLQTRVPHLDGERLLVAPGTQAVLMALLLTLAKPGDTVLAEALTYAGLKAAADVARVRLHGVAMDEHGVTPAALERACRETAATLVVLTPTMHNPTTATMPLQRRVQIAALIAKHGLTLIEDDPYVFLDPTAQPLATLIPERTYLSASLSKCLAPGLRTALLAVPDAAAAARTAATLRATLQMPAPLMTAVTLRWLQSGTADRLIAAVRAEAEARQALCREVLGAGGYAAQAGSPHIWLTAPHDWSSERFSSVLRSRGLGVVASEAFAVSPGAPPAIRAALGGVRTRGELKAALEILRDALAVRARDTRPVV